MNSTKFFMHSTCCETQSWIIKVGEMGGVNGVIFVLYTTHEAVRVRLLGNNTDRNVWAASVRMIGIACETQT